MDCDIAMKKGFALLELTLVALIIGILSATIIINGTNFINRAKFQATVREMGSIAQAAVDYYNSSNNPNDPRDPQPLSWPADISTLANNKDSNNNYIPQDSTTNPFGFNYQLGFANNMVTVSTTIPSGILIDHSEGSFLNIIPVPAGQQISITQSIPNEFSGRLDYDLQYLYKR
jgi:type II secretory pathway pseudopilin PulG